MTFDGVLAPVPTPFGADDRIDLARLRAGFSRWLPAPLAGFVVLGSTGEAALLDETESETLIDAARALVPASRPFIVGTGRESTAATIRANRRAAELGADAVLVRTPGFFKAQMTTAVLVTHYERVADESPVPVLLYNFTAVTGVNMQPAAVSRLAHHQNIIGVKESGGDVAQIADLVTSTPADFHVIAGSSTTFFAALSVGARGGILALSCLLPDACVRLHRLVRDRQYDEARDLQQQLTPIAKLVGSTYGVAGLKAALRIAGIDMGQPRSPLVPVPETAVAALKEALAPFEKAAV